MSNTKPRPWAVVCAPIGLLMILLATIVPFFLQNVEWAQNAYKYVYAIGAFVLFIARAFDGRTSSDFRLKRLYRLEAWQAVIFLVAAFFLFYAQAEMRDWLAFTIAGAALQIFTSFAIPAREAKVKKS